MKNRELKFCAWDIKKEKMVKSPYFFEQYNGESKVYEDWRDLEDGRYFVAEVMQFTGLKDKNGVDIYEGDICKTYTVGIGSLVELVEFQEGSFLFNHIHALAVELRGFKTDYIEVIGNVYETQELLTFNPPTHA